MERSFLCPRCGASIGSECRACGFSILLDNGILDFISNNPACEYLRDEIDHWDARVDQVPTWKLRETIDTIQDYFKGSSFHRSARRMLPSLRTIDLTDKVCMEVGGTGHSLAMMLKSGCKILFHLEVSKKSQIIAKRNLAQLSFGKDAQICYLRSPAESIPLPDNSLDLLMAFGTYHHTDRRRSLPEIHRTLKPGGVVYFHEAYIGSALLPAKCLTRKVRQHWGFNPGKDDPLGITDLVLLRRLFPNHRYEIRNVLDALAFVMRYVHPRTARWMYQLEVDIPGVTPIASVFLKGILFFSGQKEPS